MQKGHLRAGSAGASTLGLRSLLMSFTNRNTHSAMRKKSITVDRNEPY